MSTVDERKQELWDYYAAQRAEIVMIGEGSPDPRSFMDYERPYPTRGRGLCTSCRGAERIWRSDLWVIRKHVQGNPRGALYVKCPEHLDLWREYHANHGQSVHITRAVAR